MVPSWTETLLEAGVDVVGRTRFCVHPSARVAAIPVVGGTKDLSADQCEALRADLVLLDREENPRGFLDLLRAPVLDTHVDSLDSLASELDRLATELHAPKLRGFADRTRRVIALPPSSAPSAVPGVLEELTPYARGAPVQYVIWTEPWMAVGPATYIASVLRRLGFTLRTSPAGKYPRIDEDSLKDTFTLYSSEPFPFLKKIPELKAAGRPGAVVDGEGYSWFGVRGLRFLENSLGLAGD